MKERKKEKKKKTDIRKQVGEMETEKWAILNSLGSKIKFSAD